MPRFYFHLRTPSGLDKDEVGSEFDSLETAYLDAFDAIGTMTVDLTRRKDNPRQYGFEIADAAGKILLDLPFTEYLDRGRRPAIPPTSVRIQPIVEELRGRQDAAAHALVRCRTLRTALHEQGDLLQATLADTRRLTAETQRILAAFRPFQATCSET